MYIRFQTPGIYKVAKLLKIVGMWEGWEVVLLLKSWKVERLIGCPSAICTEQFADRRTNQQKTGAFYLHLLNLHQNEKTEPSLHPICNSILLNGTRE